MKKKGNYIIVLFSVLFFLALLGVLSINLLFPDPELEIYADVDKIDLEKNPFESLGNSRDGTNPGAPVEIEYFIDFKCGYTGEVQDTIIRVLRVYGDDVNLVPRHYPQYEGSDTAAAASECARDSGFFWEYHNLLLEHPLNLDSNSLVNYAYQLGIDPEEFISCMTSNKKFNIINEDKIYAENNMVHGTPTFLINGIMLKGAVEYEQFKEIIDEEIKSSG